TGAEPAQRGEVGGGRALPLGHASRVAAGRVPSIDVDILAHDASVAVGSDNRQSSVPLAAARLARTLRVPSHRDVRSRGGAGSPLATATPRAAREMGDTQVWLNEGFDALRIDGGLDAGQQALHESQVD